MSNKISLYLPELGVMQAKVVGWLKNIGDPVAEGEALLGIESDKAQIDVPASVAGTLVEHSVHSGDTVSVGDLLGIVSSTEDAQMSEDRVPVCMPDIGIERVTVTSLWVKDGDALRADTVLLSVESDKTQMDVPAPCAGAQWLWAVSVGQELRMGDVLGSLIRASSQALPASSNPSSPSIALPLENTVRSTFTDVYASPWVRRILRDRGDDPGRYTPRGPNGRLTLEDIARKDIPLSPSARKAAYTYSVGQDDILSLQGSGYKGRVIQGDIVKHAEQKASLPKTWPLTATQYASAQHMHHSWSTVPHVTHGDEVLITPLELRRVAFKEQGLQTSLLPFVLHAVARALQIHPRCGARLSEDGKTLHASPLQGINIAMDTPRGLLTPRVDDVIGCDLSSLVHTLRDLGEKTRHQTLSPKDYAPGSITITSLGGVGGRWFTPIINTPQIAILGIMKGYWGPVWQDDRYERGYYLPLVLSYDHRALDGVASQHFLNTIGEILRTMHQDPWVAL